MTDFEEVFSAVLHKVDGGDGGTSLAIESPVLRLFFVHYVASHH